MASPPGDVVRGLGEKIQSWSMQRRLSVAAAVAVGVVVFSAMLAVSRHQSMVPLLTNLAAEDAAQIIDRLSTEHVAYEIAAGGTAIMVPESQVHELRLKMAGEGLPKGGNVGFELFDSPNFGMSRFAEQVNYRRGLEGELRRSIRQIDAVGDARVHIVVPEAGLFREQDKPATAAITLHMRPGRQLSAGQTQAIVHLVASSVAGLRPDEVTVVDSAGTILAKGGESAGGGMSGAIDQQRNVETGIEERVRAILSPIVGAGHVVVRASARLDFARTDKTTESYDPSSQVLRSEQINEEHRTGASVAQGGVAGARSNLTGVNSKEQTMAPGATGERRNTTHNWELNKVVAHEVGAQGKLTRLSVAVLVDGIETTDADGKKTLHERSPEELKRFEELVRRAMGFDDDRDDQVVVQSMAFEIPPVLEPGPEENQTPKWVFWAERFWPPAIALLVVGIVGMSLLRRSNSEPSHELSGLLGTSPRTVRELEMALSDGSMAGSNMLANMPPDVRARLSTRLEPKLAAKVLKGWLSEV